MTPVYWRHLIAAGALTEQSTGTDVIIACGHCTAHAVLHVSGLRADRRLAASNRERMKRHVRLTHPGVFDGLAERAS